MTPPLTSMGPVISLGVFLRLLFVLFPILCHVFPPFRVLTGRFASSTPARSTVADGYAIAIKDDQVLSGQRMVLGAVSLPGIAGREGSATQAILPLGHDLQMGRVTTSAVSAQMVELHSTRNFSNHQNVRCLVGTHSSPFPVLVNGRAPISGIVFHARPFPAPDRILLGKLRQSFAQRHRFHALKNSDVAAT